MAQQFRIKLRSFVTCPHCWHRFAPHDAKWISVSPGLDDDVKLGEGYSRRFLPSRFDFDGNAIDVKKGICRDMACPECHLEAPRALFENAAIFVSVFGSPSSGKSYFLASMTWRLRSFFPKHFGLTFSDADPQFNRHVIDYEEQQFMNPNANELVTLAKTEEQGDLYHEVRSGDDVIRYPRPMLFVMRTLNHHPLDGHEQAISRLLCMYDNAGESFDPGKDTPNNPVTRHMARSQVLMFLFDPTQDPRFRAACEKLTDDPQVAEATVTSRQETILHEAIKRIRRYAGLRQDAKHKRPLLVLVTKFDAWRKLLGKDFELPEAIKQSESGAVENVDTGAVEYVSGKVRKLLWDIAPEIVAAAEGAADAVRFIPVSATGRAPEPMPPLDNGQIPLGFRPSQISPIWIEVPMAYSLAKWGDSLVGRKSQPIESLQQNDWK